MPFARQGWQLGLRRLPAPGLEHRRPVAAGDGAQPELDPVDEARPALEVDDLRFLARIERTVERILLFLAVAVDDGEAAQPDVVAAGAQHQRIDAASFPAKRNHGAVGIGINTFLAGELPFAWQRRQLDLGRLARPDLDLRRAYRAALALIGQLEPVDEAEAALEIDRPRLFARPDRAVEAQILGLAIAVDNAKLAQIDGVTLHADDDRIVAPVVAADADDIAIARHVDALLTEQGPLASQRRQLDLGRDAAPDFDGGPSTTTPAGIIDEFDLADGARVAPEIDGFGFGARRQLGAHTVEIALAIGIDHAQLAQVDVAATHPENETVELALLRADANDVAIARRIDGTLAEQQPVAAEWRQFALDELQGEHFDLGAFDEGGQVAAVEQLDARNIAAAAREIEGNGLLAGTNGQVVNRQVLRAAVAEDDADVEDRDGVAADAELDRCIGAVILRELDDIAVDTGAGLLPAERLPLLRRRDTWQQHNERQNDQREHPRQTRHVEPHPDSGREPAVLPIFGTNCGTLVLIGAHRKLERNGVDLIFPRLWTPNRRLARDT